MLCSTDGSPVWRTESNGRYSPKSAIQPCWSTSSISDWITWLYHATASGFEKSICPKVNVAEPDARMYLGQR